MSDLTDLIPDGKVEKVEYRSPYYTIHRGAPSSRVDMVKERAMNNIMTKLKDDDVDVGEDDVEFTSRESMSPGMIDYFARYLA